VKHTIFLCFIFSIVFIHFSFSQTIEPYLPEKKEKIPEVEIPKVFDIDTKVQEKTMEKILPPQQYLEQALEVEIDSASYILGPGDLLLVNIWGPLSNQIMSQITAEGYVVIPSIMDIKVAGLSLADGSEKIKMTLDKYFKDTDFTIRLMKMRKFRVYATGEITIPGTYFVRGSDSLSDLIEIAQGLSSGADETGIQLRHLHGAVDTVDISEFYRFGNNEANPYLQGGDVIYVPAVDLTEDYITIEGNFESPGIYQLKSDESLYAILSRLKLLNRESNIQNIELIRDDQNFSFNLMNDVNSAMQEMLRKGDRIYIAPIQEYVYVSGEVRQSGAFPYRANYTSKDYYGMSGPMESARSVDKIYVIRGLTGEVVKGGDVVVEKGDVVVVPQRGRENTKDIMAILTPVISITFSMIALILSSR